MQKTHKITCNPSGIWDWISIQPINIHSLWEFGRLLESYERRKSNHPILFNWLIALFRPKYRLLVQKYGTDIGQCL
jgi:hypothetical protein